MDIFYGKNKISLNLDSDRITLVNSAGEENYKKLNREEIEKKLDSPINSKRIEHIAGRNEKILIVVPDATRYVGADEIIRILLGKLAASKIGGGDIAFLIGGGIHRQPTREEIEYIIGKENVRSHEVFCHNANDEENLRYVGETKRGTKVRLNKKLVEADRVIQIGGISFHYIAGFSGGRKGILPGCGAESTIQQNHKLAFDAENLQKSKNIESGNLSGNPVHEDMLEAVAFAPPSFAINTVLNSEKEIVDVYAGHWIDSHRKGCEEYKERNKAVVREKRKFVIVSPGGFPKDLNLIQSHKAMEHASVLLEEGGTMIVVAQCSQGLGRDDLPDWFAGNSSKDTAEMLLKNYKVYGQSAWGIRWKSEKFKVVLVSDLDSSVVEGLGMTPRNNIDDALEMIDPNEKGYIIPFGLTTLPVLEAVNL